MRRAGNLFEQIVERDNLRRAFYKALRGKRSRSDVRRFADHLDDNLREMSAELSAGTFPVGRFHQFVIRDPKQRIITAPCFAERVLHHAIMNLCEPVFERWLIHDTYACRVGRGRVAALLRTRRFAGRHAAFLKCDIRKYFDSIPHERLLTRLELLLKDRKLLDLFVRIVTAFRGAAGRGLPIGSLTSQHFANFYLGWFDRFVKERLRVRGYVRYMDDMALWSDSTTSLKVNLAHCREFLDEELGLEFKPQPYINRTEHGMDFLGCRVFPRHLILNRGSRTRFRRKLAELERLHSQGMLNEGDLQKQAEALVAVTRTPGVSSWRFRQRILEF